MNGIDICDYLLPCLEIYKVCDGKKVNYNLRFMEDKDKKSQEELLRKKNTSVIK